MESYQELKVWQRSMEVVRAVYVFTTSFPKEEQFGRTSQMRRSAVSVPSNIAEGYARKTRGEYGQFVGIAFGSAAELETQLKISEMLEYGNPEERKIAAGLLDEVLRMLNVLLQRLRESPKP